MHSLILSPKCNKILQEASVHLGAGHQPRISPKKRLPRLPMGRLTDLIIQATVFRCILDSYQEVLLFYIVIAHTAGGFMGPQRESENRSPSKHAFSPIGRVLWKTNSLRVYLCPVKKHWKLILSENPFPVLFRHEGHGFDCCSVKDLSKKKPAYVYFVWFETRSKTCNIGIENCLRLQEVPSVKKNLYHLPL